MRIAGCKERVRLVSFSLDVDPGRVEHERLERCWSVGVQILGLAQILGAERPGEHVGVDRGLER